MSICLRVQLTNTTTQRRKDNIRPIQNKNVVEKEWKFQSDSNIVYWSITNALSEKGTRISLMAIQGKEQHVM